MVLGFMIFSSSFLSHLLLQYKHNDSRRRKVNYLKVLVFSPMARNNNSTTRSPVGIRYLSSSLPLVTQIRGHMHFSPPQLLIPATVRYDERLHFYREKKVSIFFPRQLASNRAYTRCSTVYVPIVIFCATRKKKSPWACWNYRNRLTAGGT